MEATYEVILFIEDIHTLVGAGGGNGAMDAAGIIKPALSRGELFCIGSTTPEEYQKYFEGDKTLASKFQNVDVDEPTVEQTISILRGAQEKYETYHKIGVAINYTFPIDECKIAPALSHFFATFNDNRLNSGFNKL